jgi:hypothetical protein
MKTNLLLGAAAGVFGLVCIGIPAQAAPLGAPLGSTTEVGQGNVEQAHWDGRRRYYRRYYGYDYPRYYRPYRYYGYEPGFNFYVGPRRYRHW